MIGKSLRRRIVAGLLACFMTVSVVNPSSASAALKDLGDPYEVQGESLEAESASVEESAAVEPTSDEELETVSEAAETESMSAVEETETTTAVETEAVVETETDTETEAAVETERETEAIVETEKAEPETEETKSSFLSSIKNGFSALMGAAPLAAAPQALWDEYIVNGDMSSVDAGMPSNWMKGWRADSQSGSVSKYENEALVFYSEGYYNEDVFQEVTLKPGKYSFGGKLWRANDAVNASITLKIVRKSDDKVINYITKSMSSGNLSTSKPSGAYSNTFEIPSSSGETTVKVVINAEASKKTLFADDIFLECKEEYSHKVKIQYYNPYAPTCDHVWLHYQTVTPTYNRDPGYATTFPSAVKMTAQNTEGEGWYIAEVSTQNGSYLNFYVSTVEADWKRNQEAHEDHWEEGEKSWYSDRFRMQISSTTSMIYCTDELGFGDISNSEKDISTKVYTTDTAAIEGIFSTSDKTEIYYFSPSGRTVVTNYASYGMRNESDSAWKTLTSAKRANETLAGKSFGHITYTGMNAGKNPLFVRFADSSYNTGYFAVRCNPAYVNIDTGAVYDSPEALVAGLTSRLELYSPNRVLKNVTVKYGTDLKDGKLSVGDHPLTAYKMDGKSNWYYVDVPVDVAHTYYNSSNPDGSKGYKIVSYKYNTVILPVYINDTALTAGLTADVERVKISSSNVSRESEAVVHYYSSSRVYADVYVNGLENKVISNRSCSSSGGWCSLSTGLDPADYPNGIYVVFKSGTGDNNYATEKAYQIQNVNRCYLLPDMRMFKSEKAAMAAKDAPGNFTSDVPTDKVRVWFYHPGGWKSYNVAYPNAENASRYDYVGLAPSQEYPGWYSAVIPKTAKKMYFDDDQIWGNGGYYSKVYDISTNQENTIFATANPAALEKGWSVSSAEIAKYYSLEAVPSSNALALPITIFDYAADSLLFEYDMEHLKNMTLVVGNRFNMYNQLGTVAFGGGKPLEAEYARPGEGIAYDRNNNTYGVGLVEKTLSSSGDLVYTRQAVEYIADAVNRALQFEDKNPGKVYYNQTALYETLKSKIMNKPGDYDSSKARIDGTPNFGVGDIQDCMDYAYYITSGLFDSKRTMAKDYGMYKQLILQKTGTDIYGFYNNYATDKNTGKGLRQNYKTDYDPFTYRNGELTGGSGTIRNDLSSDEHIYDVDGPSNPGDNKHNYEGYNGFFPLKKSEMDKAFGEGVIDSSKTIGYETNGHKGLNTYHYYKYNMPNQTAPVLVEFTNNDNVNADGKKEVDTEDAIKDGNTDYNNRNYHYGMRASGKFRFVDAKDLYFTFTGDDDVYLFINNQLAMELGGAHSSVSYTVYLSDIAEKLGLVDGQYYNFDFFYMERHTTWSNIRIETNIDVVDASGKLVKKAYQTVTKKVTVEDQIEDGDEEGDQTPGTHEEDRQSYTMIQPGSALPENTPITYEFDLQVGDTDSVKELAFEDISLGIKLSKDEIVLGSYPTLDSNGDLVYKEDGSLNETPRKVSDLIVTVGNTVYLSPEKYASMSSWPEEKKAAYKGKTFVQTLTDNDAGKNVLKNLMKDGAAAGAEVKISDIPYVVINDIDGDVTVAMTSGTEGVALFSAGTHDVDVIHEYVYYTQVGQTINVAESEKQYANFKDSRSDETDSRETTVAQVSRQDDADQAVVSLVGGAHDITIYVDSIAEDKGHPVRIYEWKLVPAVKNPDGTVTYDEADGFDILANPKDEKIIVTNPDDFFIQDQAAFKAAAIASGKTEEEAKEAFKSYQLQILGLNAETAAGKTQAEIDADFAEAIRLREKASSMYTIEPKRTGPEVPKLDEDGNPVSDDNGNPVMVPGPALDADGNYLTDDDGNLLVDRMIQLNLGGTASICSQDIPEGDYVIVLKYFADSDTTCKIVFDRVPYTYVPVQLDGTDLPEGTTGTDGDKSYHLLHPTAAGQPEKTDAVITQNTDNIYPEIQYTFTNEDLYKETTKRAEKEFGLAVNGTQTMDKVKVITFGVNDDLYVLDYGLNVSLSDDSQNNGMFRNDSLQVNDSEELKFFGVMPVSEKLTRTDSDTAWSWDFGTQSMTGWHQNIQMTEAHVEGDGKMAYAYVHDNGTLQIYATASYTGTLSYTISNIPNGTYTLATDMRVKDGVENAKMGLQSGNETVWSGAISTADSMQEGVELRKTVTVRDHTLTVLYSMEGKSPKLHDATIFAINHPTVRRVYTYQVEESAAKIDNSYEAWSYSFVNTGSAEGWEVEGDGLWIDGEKNWLRWSDTSSYSFKASYTVKGLPNGTYTLSNRIKVKPNVDMTKMGLSSGTTTVWSDSFNTADDWKQVSLGKTIEVTDGTCTILYDVNTGDDVTGGATFGLQNVVLYRIQDRAYSATAADADGYGVVTCDDLTKNTQASVTYSMKHFLEGLDRYAYAMQAGLRDVAAADRNVTNSTPVMEANVTIMPASIVYYEDSFGDIVTTGTADPDRRGTMTQGNGLNTQYGFDEIYDNSSTTSAGGVTTLKDSQMYAFTFSGTGFDIMTSTSYANMYVRIYQAVDANGVQLAKINPIGQIEGSNKCSYISVVDKDGKAVAPTAQILVNVYNENSNLYQIPAVAKRNLGRGTYIVLVQRMGGKEDLMIDGIRIYNPMDYEYSEGICADEDVNAGIIKPEIGEVITPFRNLIFGDGYRFTTNEKGLYEAGYEAGTVQANLIKETSAGWVLGGGATVVEWFSDSVTASGLTDSRIDQDKTASDLIEYAVSGPNNELYMRDAKHMFATVVEGDGILQIGAKRVGTPAESESNLKIEYWGYEKNEDGELSSTAGWHTVEGTAALNTATERYYQIDLECLPVSNQYNDKKVLMVRANGTGTVSFTNVKHSAGMNFYGLDQADIGRWTTNDPDATAYNSIGKFKESAKDSPTGSVTLTFSVAADMENEQSSIAVSYVDKTNAEDSKEVQLFSVENGGKLIRKAEVVLQNGLSFDTSADNILVSYKRVNGVTTFVIRMSEGYAGTYKVTTVDNGTAAGEPLTIVTE